MKETLESSSQSWGTICGWRPWPGAKGENHASSVVHVA